MPRFSTGRSPSRSRERDQVVGEAQQARIRLDQRLQVARLQVVLPAVEVEADAVVEKGAPCGPVDLLLHHAGEAIVGRPAVEEVSVRRLALAEGAEESRGQARLAQAADGQELVAAVAAVLLAFASHAVDTGLLALL